MGRRTAATKTHKRRPGGLTVRTDQRARFIAHIAATANVTAACELIGVSRATVYEWRAKDAAFCALWEDAVEMATDALEAEARRRALDGVQEPIVVMGRIAKDDDGNTLYVRKYSDTLMQLLLRAHRPEKFRERTETKHVGPDGGAVQVEAIRERIVSRFARLAPPTGVDGDPSNTKP